MYLEMVQYNGRGHDTNTTINEVFGSTTMVMVFGSFLAAILAQWIACWVVFLLCG